MLTRISDIGDDIIHDDGEKEEEDEGFDAFVLFRLGRSIKKMMNLLDEIDDTPAIGHKPYRAWRYTH